MLLPYSYGKQKGDILFPVTASRLTRGVTVCQGVNSLGASSRIIRSRQFFALCQYGVISLYHYPDMELYQVELDI